MMGEESRSDRKMSGERKESVRKNKKRGNARINGMKPKVKHKN
jgi:hypothetical protein